MKDDGLIIVRNDESFWGLESALRVKSGRFSFANYEILEWSNCHGWPTQRKLKKFFWGGLIVMGDLPWWKTQRFFGDFFLNGEKYKDFSKWSSCNERPAQVKNMKIFQRDEKYRDFSKWFHCNGQLAQMEDFEGGEKCMDFSKDCNG